MQLIVEEAVEVSCNAELNESTSEKSYYISGIFSTMGEKNTNGRIYPQHLWEEQVAAYQKNITSKTPESLMEYKHPPRDYVEPMEAVARIVELKTEGKYVIGKAKLLNNPENPKIAQLKALIDEGIPIGVSSRATGEVVNGIVTHFNLITYDIVPNPSDYNAYTKGLNESFENGILVGKTFGTNKKSVVEQFANLITKL